MGIINSRKNKKYGYKPRHYEFDGEGNPFQIEHKFDKFRSTVGDNKGLKGKFKSAIGELKQSSDKKASQRIFLIVAALILIFLFIIGFDLSIFYA